MTVIIITHNSLLASISKKVIKVKNGTVSEIVINENVKNVDEIEW